MSDIVARIANNIIKADLRENVIEAHIDGAVVSVDGNAAETVYGEVPTGTINGSNATFTTAFDFVPETVQLILNGMIQKRVQDYNTSGTETITLNVSPSSGETLTINYQKA